MASAPLTAEEARSLQVQGLVKRFSGGGANDRANGRAGAGRDVVALDGVDIEARPGEVVSVIGPSGCGKSTIFNIVAGIDEPSAGRVLIGGVVLEDRLGASSYMPQHDALLAWRSVIDNVALPLALRGARRGAARAEVRPLLDRFGLGAFAEHWPWQLSGGMRQRAAFLRTVVADRPLMLLDEPFGALDGITRADLQEWVVSVWAELGTTVLFITHDITEAVLLSDRVYVMTPRPGTIAAVLELDLPRPRDIGRRDDDAFVDAERRLRRALRDASFPGDVGPGAEIPGRKGPRLTHRGH